jgi:acetoin utilization deacetylase AcuC-like enzyme
MDDFDLKNYIEIFEGQNMNSKIAISPGIESFQKMIEFNWGDFHIEQPYRLINILSEISNMKKIKNLDFYFLQSEEANEEEIQLIHTKSFIDELNLNNPKLIETSIVACGAVVGLIKEALCNKIKAGFAIVRPAGHHSSQTKRGTFCGINSVLVAAYLAAEKGKRVFIFDIDSHFAGGSEEILLSLNNPNIFLMDFYISLYDKKVGEKCRDSKNIEMILLPDKLNDKTFLENFQKSVDKCLLFAPDIILVSYGYDLAWDDKEGGGITNDGFRIVTSLLCDLSLKMKAPLICALEGGYSNNLGKYVASTLEILCSKMN